MEDLKFEIPNPTLGLKPLKERKKRSVYLSPDDYALIRQELPPLIGILADVAYFSGARQGEIRKLKLSQLSLRERLIRLEESVPKETADKVIPIHKELVPKLKWVLAQRKPAVTTDRVFLLEGKPISKEQIRSAWIKAVEKALTEAREKAAQEAREMPDFRQPIRFHDLRHVWKRNSRKSGIHERVSKAIMGHSLERVGSDMGDHYDAVYEEDLLEGIDQFTIHHGPTRIRLPIEKNRKHGDEGVSTGAGLPKVVRRKGKKARLEVSAQCHKDEDPVVAATGSDESGTKVVHSLGLEDSSKP